MGLQGYVGSAEDQRRIRRQEKQREEERQRFEELKKEREANIDKAGLRQFGTATSEVLENAFKNETVGLVTREEFVEKRKTLADRLADLESQKKRAAETAIQQAQEKRKKLKAEQSRKSKLSFMDDAEDEAEQEHASAGVFKAVDDQTAAGIDNLRGATKLKLGKDPSVLTDFLPDKEREQQEAELRAKLRREYEQQQETLKSEPLSIVYSYWNGSGHRRTVIVKKGDSVGIFLAHVKDQLGKEFREVRTMSVSNMMYVKEDIILPHSVTFYDLIKSKARGKSGPLFHFDVHDDIRLQSDARIEKDESHAGKVVDKHWFEKNKHIFPASRWEQYDPERQHDQYTVHDRLKGT